MVRNRKKGEFSQSLLKSKPNRDQLWKFPKQTNPVQSYKQNSIQLILQDQPYVGHFLFMPLGTRSKLSQGWYEAKPLTNPLHLRKFQYDQLSINQTFTGNLSVFKFRFPESTFMRFSILYPLLPFYTEILWPHHCHLQLRSCIGLQAGLRISALAYLQ